MENKEEFIKYIQNFNIDINDIEKKYIDVAESEEPLWGIVKYGNKQLERLNILPGDKVSFQPNSEYEFIINGERLYRVMNKFITIKYEYQGNEEEYNPSWAKSS